MKILYACHQFFPDCYTGTERYTLELAKQMQRMGHHATVLTYALNSIGQVLPSADGMRRGAYEYEGVPVIALQHTDLAERGGVGGVSFEIQDRATHYGMDRILAEEPFDLLHCVHPMRVGEAIKVAKRRGLKVVLHLMDYWLLCPRGTLRRVDGTLCEGPDGGRACAQHCYPASMAPRIATRCHDHQAFLANVDAVVSPSTFLLDVFQRNGIETAGVIWSPYGFDYGKVRAGSTPRERAGTITFGFIGTLQQHKGAHVLIDAFRRLSEKHIRLQLHGGFFGEYEYYASLLAAARGDPRITFGGEYEFNDVATLLEGMDVVVVPSVWYENAPIVISTAQASGIPVVASAMGGMAEMVEDGVNGFTFRLGDAEELSHRIRFLASNPDVLKEMSRNSVWPPRIEAEAFSLEMLYSALVNEPRHGPARSGLGPQRHWIPPLFSPNGSRPSGAR